MASSSVDMGIFEGVTSGTDSNGKTWQVYPARYAQGKVIFHCPSDEFFRSQAAIVCERLGGKYTHRESGYSMTPKKAKEAIGVIMALAGKTPDEKNETEETTQKEGTNMAAKKEYAVDCGIENDIVSGIGRIVVGNVELDAITALGMDAVLEAYAQTRYAMAHLELQKKMLEDAIDAAGGMAAHCDKYDSGENGTLTLTKARSTFHVKLHKLIEAIGPQRLLNVVSVSEAELKKECSKLELENLEKEGIVKKIPGEGFSMVYNKPTVDSGLPAVAAQAARAKLAEIV